MFILRNVARLRKEQRRVESDKSPRWKKILTARYRDCHEVYLVHRATRVSAV